MCIRDSGEGVLGLGFLVCVFHLGGPPGFLGYATKTQFWVTKWGGMLYEVIIQYWGGKGLSLIHISCPVKHTSGTLS